MRAADEWSVVGQRAFSVSEVGIPPLLAAPHKSHQVGDLALQWQVGSVVRADLGDLRGVERLLSLTAFVLPDPDVGGVERLRGGSPLHTLRKCLAVSGRGSP